MRIFLALCCLVALSARAETFSAKVIVVMDGDTVMVLRDCDSPVAKAVGEQRHSSCKRKLKIRLSNVDAPEMEQAFGRQSRDSLQELLGDREVQIDSRAVDKFGRIVGMISAGGLNINQEQVRRGMAWAAPGWYKKRRIQEKPVAGGAAPALHANAGKTFITLQNEARLGRRGLWEQANPLPPWQWRKLHAVEKPSASANHH